MASQRRGSWKAERPKLPTASRGSADQVAHLDADVEGTLSHVLRLPGGGCAPPQNAQGDVVSAAYSDASESQHSSFAVIGPMPSVRIIWSRSEPTSRNPRSSRNWHTRRWRAGSIPAAAQASASRGVAPRRRHCAWRGRWLVAQFLIAGPWPRYLGFFETVKISPSPNCR